MSRIALKLLGTPVVELDGEAVRLGLRKAMALLVYLAVTKSPHSRDSLATLLWPGSDQARARADLRHALSLLRRKLGADHFEADRETISLREPDEVWLDTNAFRQLVGAWRDHGHSEAEVCKQCLDGLEQAMALYRGDFLAGFTLRDAPGFDEWQFFETEGLRDELAGALERLASHHRAKGDYEAAIGYARRWVGLDPLHEPAQRALIEAYAAAGQRAAAPRQYDECRRILQAEMRLSPSCETTALYERIRVGTADRAEPVAAPQPSRHSLPAQPIPLVGRERELAEIGERLQDPNCRLLTLVGPGGSGKTRLAIETAARTLNAFGDGVFFVSLAGLQSAESIVPTTAQTIGLSFFAEHDPEEQLLAYLSPRRMLLVLDNFEHLLSRAGEGGPDGARRVSAIVEAAPRIKLLVTSRAALNVQYEQLYPVRGMSFPERGAVLRDDRTTGDPTGYSAVELLVQSARRLMPHFELTPENVDDVVNICRLVAGLPLGVLLASAWVRMMTPTEIAAQLEMGLDLLETGLRDVPARQRSMRAVFDHSWRLLTGRERSVMEALSVFRGGFTRRAARAVTGATLLELRSLVDRSLVQMEDGGRYGIHELLRQYASERLAESTLAAEAARDRHSAYYTAALERWGEELKGPRQREALEELDLEIDNARAAWDWTATRCCSEQLSRAAFGLAYYYERCARFVEAESAFRAAAARLSARARVPSDGRAGILTCLARVLTVQARFAWWLGHSEVACRLSERSIELLGRSELAGGDARSEGPYAWFVLGRIQRTIGRGDFRRSWERSLDLARSVGDLWTAVQALAELASCENYSGDLQAARRKGEECLEIARSLGDVRSIGETLSWLGGVCGHQGEMARGESLARESIQVLEGLGDPVMVAAARTYLSGVLAQAGRYAESCGQLEKALAESVDLGISRTERNTLSSLGWVEMMMGEYEQARGHLETGLRLGREAGSVFTATTCSCHLATLAMLEGHYAEAKRMLRECVDAFEGVACGEYAVACRCWLAAALRGQRETDAARDCVVQTLVWSASHGSLMNAFHALTVAPLLLMDQGETERAVEVLELARTFPFQPNSQWQEDLVGKPVVEAAASLPSHVVAAAKDRGRSRDVWATVHDLISEWGE